MVYGSIAIIYLDAGWQGIPKRVPLLSKTMQRGGDIDTNEGE